MKKAITCILFIFISIAAYNQAVGYQGNKFILLAGYAPVNNGVAILLDYHLIDDHYSNDFENPGAKDPILIRHVPKIEMEYVVARYASLFFRYNPFKHISNAAYYDDFSNEQVDLVGVDSKGNMFSFGYRSYLSGNIAPLGSYFGLYGTIFNYNSEFVESKFADHPLPESFLEYPSSSDKMFGLFMQYGVKNIFWDQLILDIQFDAGYFFKDTDEIKYLEEDNPFYPYFLGNPFRPDYYTVFNTRAFFFVTPSVNVGWLIF